MTKTIHPLAAALAILTIATFWLSTALSELLASQATVTAVKTAIPWGFLVLIPALALPEARASHWRKVGELSLSALRQSVCRS